MQKIFYQPRGYWFGDCMPFYQNGTYYLYHQRDTRIPRPLTAPFGWSLVTTTDFVHFTDYGEVIGHGTDNDADQFIYAGSVIARKDEAIAIYTGHNRPAKLAHQTSEILMQATSKDLIHWQKQGPATALTPQAGYDHNDWRDPTVVFNPTTKTYWLILGSRLIGSKKAPTGRLVYFESADFTNWQFKGDFWSPQEFNMIEMPQVFAMGAKWYLIFSEYSEAKITKYRISDHLNGPWHSPRDEAFDGKAYYAARTVGTNETGRYLVGWVATKENNQDLNNFDWGGSLVPHQIVPQADHSLGVKLPQTIVDHFQNHQRLSDLKLKSPVKMTKIILPELSPYFLLSGKLEFAPGTKEILLRLRENPQTRDCYEYKIALNWQQLSFDKSPNYPWPQLFTKGLARPLALKAQQQYDFQLIVDDTLAICYLDGVALSTRMEEQPGNALSLGVNEGQVQFSDLTYATGYESGF